MLAKQILRFWRLIVSKVASGIWSRKLNNWIKNTHIIVLNKLNSPFCPKMHSVDFYVFF